MSLETARRHTLERYEKDLKVAQDLEMRLGIVERWVPGCPEWERAGVLVSMQHYQRALDHLEGLIVARMFELTKMNMSQTGAYIQIDSYILVCLNNLYRIQDAKAYLESSAKPLTGYPICT